MDLYKNAWLTDRGSYEGWERCGAYPKSLKVDGQGARQKENKHVESLLLSQRDILDLQKSTVSHVNQNIPC